MDRTIKRISVKAIPNAKLEKITETGVDSYKIHLMTPPVDGKANEQILKILSRYLKVKINQITQISGFTSREKTFEIKTNHSEIE